LMLLVCLCAASRGDKDFQFRECVVTCSDSKGEKCLRFKEKSDFWLKLLGWSCEDDCSYQCMWKITNERINEGLSIFKYFGKWPFVRIFGMQEIGSVVFSLGNLLPNLFYVYLYKRFNTSYRYKGYWIFFGLITANAWIWSIVFHARDNYYTERMDYFSALLAHFANSWAAVIITLELRMPITFLISLVFGSWYLCHISYLQFIKFDYEFNIVVAIIQGLVATMFWFYWVWKNYYHRPHAWKIGTTFIILWIAGALELWDFPPFLFLFDAHSLWHLATIPMYFMIWNFAFDEAKFYSGKKEKGTDKKREHEKH